MVHTVISIDGSYSFTFYEDSFNLYESDRIVLDKGSDKWYSANSDCSMCIYPKYGSGYAYLCKNKRWKGGRGKGGGGAGRRGRTVSTMLRKTVLTNSVGKL